MSCSAAMPRYCSGRGAFEDRHALREVPTLAYARPDIGWVSLHRRSADPS